MNLIYLTNDPRGFVTQILSLIEDKSIAVINDLNYAILSKNNNIQAKNISSLNDEEKEKLLISDFFMSNKDLTFYICNFYDLQNLLQKDFFNLSKEFIDGIVIDFEKDEEISLVYYLFNASDWFRGFFERNRFFLILKNKGNLEDLNEVSSIEEYLEFFELTKTTFLENIDELIQNSEFFNKNVTLKIFDNEKLNLLEKSISPTEKENLIGEYKDILRNIRTKKINPEEEKEYKNRAVQIIQQIKMLDKISFFKSLIAKEFKNFKEFMKHINTKEDKFEKVDVSVETDN